MDRCAVARRTAEAPRIGRGFGLGAFRGQDDGRGHQAPCPAQCAQLVHQRQQHPGQALGRGAGQPKWAGQLQRGPNQQFGAVRGPADALRLEVLHHPVHLLAELNHVVAARGIQPRADLREAIAGQAQAFRAAGILGVFLQDPLEPEEQVLQFALSQLPVSTFISGSSVF
jgi:hypothetical protein